MYAIHRDTDRSAIVITVPQRRTCTKNKNRLRWAEAKAMALAATSCTSTKEVRKWLNALGVGGMLTLTMTSAWVAVRVDLADAILSEKEKMERDFSTKVVQISDYRSKNEKTKSDIEIVYEAMLDAIASKNWEYLRPCLVDREQHKIAAWKLLSDTQKQQLNALVPLEIQILKAAVKGGAIASFKEDPEGDMFWVQQRVDSPPVLLSGTMVRNLYRKT